jgi:hypothetical protein
MVNGYVVVARPQIRENEQAILVRSHLLLQACAGFASGNAGVRNYSTGVVVNRTLNASIYALAVNSAR